MTSTTMKVIVKSIPGVGLLLLGATDNAVAGDFGDRLQQRTQGHDERVDDRLVRLGDPIEARGDRRGERVDRHWDRRH